ASTAGSEDQLCAEAEHRRRANTRLTRPDNLDVGCHQQPLREGEIVIRLKPPFVSQEVHCTARVLKRWTLDTDVEVADSELVERTPGDQTFAADAGTIEVLRRIGVALGGAEASEQPDAFLRSWCGLVQELIEVVEGRPRAVLRCQRLVVDHGTQPLIDGRVAFVRIQPPGELMSG